ECPRRSLGRADRGPGGEVERADRRSLQGRDSLAFPEQLRPSAHPRDLQETLTRAGRAAGFVPAWINPAARWWGRGSKFGCLGAVPWSPCPIFLGWEGSIPCFARLSVPCSY